MLKAIALPTESQQSSTLIDIYGVTKRNGLFLQSIIDALSDGDGLLALPLSFCFNQLCSELVSIVAFLRVHELTLSRYPDALALFAPIH